MGKRDDDKLTSQLTFHLSAAASALSIATRVIDPQQVPSLIADARKSIDAAEEIVIKIADAVRKV